MVKHGFTAGEVLRLTGLTYRQLDHWARTDFVSPSKVEQVGQKTKRLYTFTDVLAIRAAMRLLDAGIPLQRLRQAVNRLQNELTKTKKETLHSLVWLTDGENLFILKSRDIALDVLRGQYVFAFTVDVGQLADKLNNDVSILEKRLSSRGTQRRYKCPDLAAIGE